MKEQQITEEKPLLPEQRGVDSDMVSPPGLFTVCVLVLSGCAWADGLSAGGPTPKVLVHLDRDVCAH